jgi:hypothetical protein
LHGSDDCAEGLNCQPKQDKICSQNYGRENYRIRTREKRRQKLFQERINYLLNKNEGWKPLGGIALAGTGSAVIMAQSMVKISQGA